MAPLNGPLNLSFEPQTAEGKRLKAVFGEAAKVNGDFEKARQSLSFEVILSPQRLQRHEGVEQSTGGLDAAAKGLQDVLQPVASDRGSHSCSNCSFNPLTLRVRVM